ncbi:MAG: phosphotransferase family protein [Actinocrinis sp.]
MSNTETQSALTIAEAEALLRPLRPSAVVTRVLARDGSGFNSVYELRCAEPDPAVIVKFYPARWLQAKELHVYGLLAGHGVGPIPELLHAAPDGGPGEGGYTVMSLLPGRPLEDVAQRLSPDDTRGIYRQIGACLASIHRIELDAFGYLTDVIVDPQPTNAASMTRRFGTQLTEFAAQGGDPALCRDVAAYVDARAELFELCRVPVLVHNDIHEGNVLVARDGAGGSGGWRMTGFIDVENAVAADPLLDLARTSHFAVHGDAAKWQALVDGYGPLGPHADERVTLYGLYQAVELWSWFASIGRTERLPAIADEIRSLLS